MEVSLSHLDINGLELLEIHRRLYRVYGGVMSDSSDREWCRKFRDGRTYVHDKGGQERQSIVTDELIHKVIREFR
jgi:hypothetical protein